MINKILQAAKLLENVSNKTPVMTSRTLNEQTGLDVYLKCENFQRIGAFKFRGAYNAIYNLSEENKKNGIITHSSGNHAQAVALVGKLLSIDTTIVMPKNAPLVKIQATKQYGAEVVFSESTIQDREDTCNALIKKNNLTLIHPYDNDMVIAGAATASKEFTDDYRLDIMITPCGGGGLLSGTAIYCKESNAVQSVFGAEPEMANDAYLSFKNSVLHDQVTPNTIADGLRTTLSNRTFKYISKYVDDIILVSEEEIKSAMEFLWTRMKLIVEPSGAVPLAAIIKLAKNNDIIPNTKVGIILSGGNVELTNYFSSL
ncbi:MAG: pyridoxal-phosphate dependent enzyme [Candidatus Heimdallarchaeota archaeon]|nr:pyridoxal-phosphate dependent enzyme [Candidatus Heimdallarchaeota archaeon]MDH5646156.1 pyridoxal-phosphate dependent enzyme [Candidatus Heimdallarchaeota archaeon]